jgi:DNA-binding GntR family transcriptional regulator
MAGVPAAEVGQRLSRAVHVHSPVPLHHQIKVAVLQGIEAGWLHPGSRLPRERALADALGVSLAPVRQALADLAREGYVDRTRGRGTFVRERAVVEKIAILGSFHEALRREGVAGRLSVLADELVAAPKHVKDALNVQGRVWLLRRLAFIDDDPVALLTAWLPAGYATALSGRRDFGAESLYAALASVHGAVMSYADNIIEVARAGLVDADWLRLPLGTPVLRVVGLTRDQNKTLVEYSDVLYHAERFRFSIESRRTANGVTYVGDPGAMTGVTDRDLAGSSTSPTQSAKHSRPATAARRTSPTSGGNHDK